MCSEFFLTFNRNIIIPRKAKTTHKKVNFAPYSFVQKLKIGKTDDEFSVWTDTYSDRIFRNPYEDTLLNSASESNVIHITEQSEINLKKYSLSAPLSVSS